MTYKTHATDGRLRFTCVSQDEFSVDKLFKNADMRGLVFHCDNCGRSLTKCVICGWLTCEDCHGGICYLCGNELYVDLKRNDFSTDSCTGVRLVPPSADYGKRIYYNVYDDNDEEDDYYFFEIDEIVDYLDEEHEKVGEFCYNCDELMTGICKSCGSYYCQNYTCEDVMDTCDLCGASLRSEDYDDYEPIDFDFFHWSDSHHSYNFTFTENKGNQTEKKELIATVRKANSTIIRGKKKMSLAKRIPISKAKEHKGTDLTINKVKAPVKSTAKTSVAKKRSKSAIKDKNISEVQLSALMEDQKQVLNDSRIGKKQHELDHEHDEVMIVNTRWHMEQNKRQYASSFFNRQGLIFDISEWFRWDPKIHNWTTQKKRILKGYEIFENNLFEKITRYSTTLGKCDCPDFIKRAKPCKHMYCIAIVVDVSLPISYDDYKNNLYMNIW